MATKSPGIYFTEYDNTAYTNPKSVSGTTVCIVGFASKGEIGVPTEITSYKNYTSTFGDPIEGYYSGLAVKNVLTAGGKVLFVRVADSTAEASNIVIKNTVEAENGKVTFDRSSDILVGTSGYSIASLYGINITNPAGTSKNIYLRSPSTGKFTQASILSQLSEGLGATAGFYEVLKRNTIKAGIFSFEIAVNDMIVNDLKEEIPEDEQGFFIETTADMSGETLAEALQQAISNGPNGICYLTLSTDKTGVENGYFDAKTKTFSELSGNKKFLLTKGLAPITIKIDITAGSTLQTIANVINTATSSYGVRCLLVEGDEANNTPPRLLFINKTGSEDLILLSSTSDTESKDELFLTNNKVTESTAVYSEAKPDGTENPNEKGWFESNDSGYFLSEDTEVDSEKTYYAAATVTSETSNLSGFAPAINTSFGLYVNTEFNRSSTSGRTTVSVEYNENTKSIVFTGSDEGDGEKVEVVAAPNGTFIFDESDGANVGTVIGSILGTDALDGLDIARDSSTRQIYIESENEIQYATVADIEEENENILSLIAIEKDVNDSSSTGYTYTTGQIATDASQRDIVVLTTKEKGEGTAGVITVEFYSSTSPISGVTKHDITVTVDGVLKETFEDVSYTYSDVENRFDTIINQTEDNGGSAYITALVVKNDLTDNEVQIEDGAYTVGSPADENSVKRLSDVDVTSYTSYDYSVGSNGIPDDGGDELFEEAMEVGTSALADKDLFSYHVLITPDNISETVQTAAIAICEDRGDALAIVDPPVGLSRDNVINWHNGRGYGRATALQSTYAATYWPWCKVYDTNQKKNIWVMPSVVMAAKYVTVDRTAGCWYAPAGETNGVMSVIDIEQYPNVLDRDKLYVDYNRVNPFIRLGDGSIICYGEKTLQRTNSVLTKIHTRRMLVQVKKEAKEALRGYIFMPNTTENLSKISSNLTAIFEKYKSGGGISYYSVVCDETNNPTEVRQQDIINVDVALVPEGCIEQINISLTLNKTSETVSVS